MQSTENGYKLTAETTDEFENILEVQHTDHEVRLYKYDNPEMFNADADGYEMPKVVSAGSELVNDDYRILSKVVKTQYPESDIDEFANCLRSALNGLMYEYKTNWEQMDDSVEIVERIVQVESDRLTDECADAGRNKTFGDQNE